MLMDFTYGNVNGLYFLTLWISAKNILTGLFNRYFTSQILEILLKEFY